MKAALQNLLLILVSILVVALVGELMVRVIVAPPPLVDMASAEAGLRKLIVFDDRLESRYRPNARAVIRSQYGEFEIAYEINELGLRDRPLEAARGSGAPRRIMVLGNSMAEGWGVAADKGFVRVAEGRLNGTGAKAPVRVVNAGISGYGAAQSHLLLLDLYERVRPDAVVFVYLSSMVHFDRKFLDRAELDQDGLARALSVDAVLQGGKPPAAQGSARMSPVLRAVAEHSALVRMGVLLRLASEERARIVPGDPRTDLLAGLRAAPDVLPGLHEPSLRHVAAVARFARERGLPFLMVHLPLPHQIAADEWAKGREAYGLERRVYEAPDRAVVAAFCERENIACVAAHDVLGARTQQSGKLFYDYDFHPNERGNAVLGAWFAEQLSRLGG